ncbi:MAG: SUMF1/EgtB/PvdO family nonheme iron enzyme [Anaerolineales bacterium]
MPDRKLKVFLCHASQDKPIVRDIYSRLVDEGWIDPWLDEEKLLPGQDWNMEIEKAVEAADAVVVCLSNHSVTKEGYVQRELRFALDIALTKPEETIFIIPLRLEECQPPRRLRGWQYADYFPQEQRDGAYVRLYRSLEARAEGIGVSPKLKSANLPNTIITQPEKPVSLEYRYSSSPPSPKEEFAKPSAKLTLDRMNLGGIEFCRIPAGPFLMGSTASNEDIYGDEKPQHRVVIPYDYWIARFPVTNVQYAQYTNAVSKMDNLNWQSADHPVAGIFWQDARAYCQWLNKIHKRQLPQIYVLRMPSEAEWEKAARGVSGNIWPWGDEFDPAKCNSAKGKKRGTTTPVGLYSSQGDSPYGCADMSGNVWEWTHSVKKPYPYKADDGRENEKDTSARVLRGGSFLDDARSTSCACRNAASLHDYSIDIGFRLALAPKLS